ncbi:MAG: lysophospholipid acyltransferase family protein [Bacteroidota bacterium]
MKQFGYCFFKYWVAIGLFCYYKSIKVVGVDDLPKDAPILFLSNHQNALMDILLIATRCKRKPWFLTRADVFNNEIFRPLFKFLQMLPVFRIRDGRANVPKNKGIFEKCGQLLDQGEAILVFPEANHSLKRRVRPLSKGFTRIIDTAIHRNANLELTLVPIGQNYQSPQQAGDRATLYFGKPITVQPFKGEHGLAGKIKKAVFEELKQLTTHIEGDNYENVLSELEDAGLDFTQPRRVNMYIKNKHLEKALKETKSNNTVARFLFKMNNLPLVFLWNVGVRPRVPEPEFEATFRFGFALVVYPMAYFLVLILLSYFYDLKTAGLWVMGHAVFNLILVKLFGITSSHQRR